MFQKYLVGTFRLCYQHFRMRLVKIKDLNTIIAHGKSMGSKQLLWLQCPKVHSHFQKSGFVTGRDDLIKYSCLQGCKSASLLTFRGVVGFVQEDKTAYIVIINEINTHLHLYGITL